MNDPSNNTWSVPSNEAVPLTTNRSDCVLGIVPPSSIFTLESFSRVNEPTVSVPAVLLPGETVPPLATVTGPFAVPRPASVLPSFTVTSPRIEPLTASVPALIVVPPV